MWESSQVMWESRSELWTTVPPSPPATQALLDNYFEHRRVDWPERPRPTWERVAGVVLAPARSAPGADSIPYELLHVG
eukprot:5215270-Alexandrium_andersonii.AAC.1